jgi:hypothetical protein
VNGDRWTGSVCALLPLPVSVPDGEWRIVLGPGNPGKVTLQLIRVDEHRSINGIRTPQLVVAAWMEVGELTPSVLVNMVVTHAKTMHSRIIAWCELAEKVREQTGVRVELDQIEIKR